MFKKLVSLIILAMVVMIPCGYAAGEVEVSVQCEENLMFSTYNIDVYMDGEYVATIPHGKEDSYSLPLDEGNHTLSITKEDDSSVVGHYEFSVSGDTTALKFACECKNNKVKIEAINTEKSLNKNNGKSLNSGKSLDVPTQSAPQEGEGMLGDAYIKILNAKTGKDVFGSSIVIIEFEYTNHDSREKSFGGSVDVKVYQNGVECDANYFESDDKWLDVKSGSTQTLKLAYDLNGKGEIQIEVTESGWFSSSDNMIVQTIKTK